MQDSRRTTEIIVAIGMLLLASITLFIVFATCLEYFQVFSPNPLFDKQMILELAIRKNYLPFALSTFGFISAILILRNSSKTSWLLLIISWVLYTTFTVINALKLLKNNERENDLFWIVFFIALFLLFCGLLLQRKFTRFYNPSKKNYLTIIACVPLLVFCKLSYS